MRRRALLGLISMAAATAGVGAPLAAPAVHAAAGDLFFSEYIEGSSNNKALEVYNATGAAVDLAAGGYNLQMFFNGSASAGLTINLAGSVADGDVFVLAQSSANATILAQADQTNGAGWFNGDDAVVLRKGTTVLDVIGQVGVDPGAEWGSGLASTADNTLRRKPSVCAGDTNGGDAFDPATQWDGFATDTFDGLGAHVSTCGGDQAPAIMSTSPANGAAGVNRDATLTVTFSEPVDVAGDWLAIECSATGTHTATVSGGPTTFAIDPAVNFGPAESCTVTVTAENVTDQDTSDPPDTMAAGFAWVFTTTDATVCGEPATMIHDVQGNGLTSPLVGQTVSIEGVVVGDYQGNGQFGGYFVQEEDAQADADPNTSEGMFVFSSTPVAVGDVVRVEGTVAEFPAGATPETELTAVSNVQVCAQGASVTPTEMTMPVASIDDWERVEGMLVHIDADLTVTETFTLGRFGEVSLSVGGRLYTPTAVVAPGAPAAALQDLNDRSRITLDDGSNRQNPDPIRWPAPGLSASNTLREGDTVHGLTGVLDQRFAQYRIQPVADVGFDHTNPRPDAPAPVTGGVKVAAMNVLNFFNGDGLGGGFPTARGAETQFELDRQTAKLVNEIIGLDADIVGLMEIENDGSGPNSALAELTGAVNARLGDPAYAYIDTGVIGTDAIRVALIYRPATVTPVGAFALLTTAVDPEFLDTKNRPALAQTFAENANGQRFTVAVNHLKSKGSDCNDLGDPDTGDGQGNCNVTRTRAAAALARWLANDPTHSGDPDRIIVGDLNSYAMEDPISALQDAGYTNLIRRDHGLDAYSYVFDGQSGYLDHALASPTMAAQVTGAEEWHINADEPVSLDYNTNFKSAGQITSLYDPGAFRASDHDPVLVGVCQAPTASFSVTPNVLGAPNHKYATIEATPTLSADVTSWRLVSATSNEADNGLGDGDTPHDIVIVDRDTVNVRAERSGTGTGRIYTFTWEATNACGATATATATVTVPK